MSNKIHKNHEVKQLPNLFIEINFLLASYLSQ